MCYLNNFICLSGLGISDIEALDSITNSKKRYLKEIVGFLPESKECALVALPFDSFDNKELDNTEYVSNFIIPKEFECRNNYLISSVLDKIDNNIQTIIQKYGIDRIGCIVGTSTSAISEIENEIENGRVTIEDKLPYSPKLSHISICSDFVKARYKLSGPCYTVATACSSSARALISAANLLKSNMLDAVIVIGVDSLNKTTVSGFYALGALSTEPCLPFNDNRKGITIGEAVGVTIVTKEKIDEKAIRLLGYAGSSDAHHISAPEPNGLMGIEACNAALSMAQLTSNDIGYVNMHGTGTKLNDSMEANIIRSVFNDYKVPVSSSKHLTGHTLGAAAMVEAYVAYLILNYDSVLPSHNSYKTEDYTEFKDINLIVTNDIKLTPNKKIMSNSFAFGGNNASLIFGK